MSASLRFASYYLEDALKSTNDLVNPAKRTLEDVNYDTMVGTGMSGALVIPTLARELGKHWLILRKDHVESHANQPAEGRLGERWLFVDDFISSGATFKRVYRKVDTLAARYRHKSEFAGAYLYANYPDPLFRDADYMTGVFSVPRREVMPECETATSEYPAFIDAISRAQERIDNTAFARRFY